MIKKGPRAGMLHDQHVLFLADPPCETVSATGQIGRFNGFLAQDCHLPLSLITLPLPYRNWCAWNAPFQLQISPKVTNVLDIAVFDICWVQWIVRTPLTNSVLQNRYQLALSQSKGTRSCLQPLLMKSLCSWLFEVKFRFQNAWAWKRIPNSNICGQSTNDGL